MNTKKRKKQIWKLPKNMFYFFLLCIFLLYGKLLYLSLSPTVYGKNMKEFAATRNTVRKTIPASRGSIYDVNGNPLAINVSSYTLIAYLDESRSKDSSVLKHVQDIDSTAASLAEVLEVDEEKIKTILETGKENNKYQVEFGSIGKGITELKKDEILALNLPGISFIESTKRYYPNGNFASYILGYAKESEVEEDGETTTQIVGELGIEKAYNSELKGVDGYLEYQQDRYGYKISGTKEINTDAEDGLDVYLTIDSNIQRFVEAEIEDMEEYDPEWAVLTVMDAKTGEILGASSIPSYDPNVRDITSYENPFAVSSYEPGSTMKIYTYLCAIETGNYDGNFEYKSGSIKIGDNTINDWNNTGWGTITLDKGFEYSSNVGIVNLIQQYLSKEQLKECLKSYGFGSTTGIEFDGESAGQINFKYEVEVATAGFGQGIKTTVLQQLQAATIISSGGYLIKPHLVKKIVNPNTNETVYETEISKSEQIVKKSSVEKVKELMYNTIHGTDSGTAGKTYNIEGFDLIGKTGTAQIYENGKGYLTGDNNYIFSSVIMFPKDDPQIIIYGAMKKPSYGKSKGLSDAVKNLVKNIAKYKNIYEETSTSTEVKSLTLSSYIGKNKEDVVKTLENYNLDVIVVGTGDQIIDQYPKSGTRRIENDKVILLTTGDKVMPDITGWSRNEVTELATLLNLNLKIEGSGYVSKSSIKKDTIIEGNDTLEVTLTSKQKEE